MQMVTLFTGSGSSFKAMPAPAFYKYGRRVHIDGLLELGGIRVGTLHDFRRMELGIGISDPDEGKKRVSHEMGFMRVRKPGEVTALNTQDASAPFAFEFFPPEASFVSVSGIRFHKEFDTPNHYVYCFSDTLSHSTMLEFEGANSCVAITNPTEFLHGITREIMKQTAVVSVGLCQVTYSAREENWTGQDWGGNPISLKLPKYQGQHEWRAVWKPISDESIEPILIGTSELGAYCKHVTVPLPIN